LEKKEIWDRVVVLWHCDDCYWSGAYDDEEVAAHAYDLAALKYWGPETILNFPVILYQYFIDMRQKYLDDLAL